MKNPLNKRYFRELKKDIAKYIVLFSFLTLMIGFVSGFMIAVNSMHTAYINNFAKSNVEDGNFELTAPASELLTEHMKEKEVKLYENYYFEEQTDAFESKLRVYKVRRGFNEICVMAGKEPETPDEIAIDRMYAVNNGLEISDTISLAGRKLRITGMVALSDYTSLYENSSDMMFDAKKFGVAVMTPDGFDAMASKHLHYNYAWVYEQKPVEEAEKKERGEEVLSEVMKYGVVTSFLPQYANLAINMAAEDLGKDGKIVELFLYIVMTIIAFIFAVTISNTIRQEAGVIGTLRASGFKRREVVIHYLCIPVAVTLVSALIGNLLGYTIFKEVAASMYYGSYSLPTYQTLWNAEAFLKTTVIPVSLMLLINLLILIYKMRISPLMFLRGDLSTSKRNKNIFMSAKIPIMIRFRARIILQNIPNYLTLVAGIFFANIILLLGLALPAIIYHNQESITEHMLAGNQYILKMSMPTDTHGAEAFHITSLKTYEGKLPAESVQIYGVRTDSAYVKADFLTEEKLAEMSDEQLKEEGVYISSAYAQKYGIEIGESVDLKEPYGEKTYSFCVKGIYEYPSILTVFMTTQQFCSYFDMEPEEFNGYFTQEEITDIDDTFVLSRITEDELTKLARQMDISFGKLIHLITALGVVMFMLIIFLLSKLIIEKNATSISMCKILGYKEREIAGLYILSTGIVVIAALIGTIPIVDWLMEYFCISVLSEFPGWLPYYVPFDTYIKMVVLGVLSYGVITFFQYGRVKRIPLHIALKNVE